ncbi:MAG: hypothetical protein ACKVOK_12625 [Flavobacteriales bacterium]
MNLSAYLANNMIELSPHLSMNNANSDKRSALRGALIAFYSTTEAWDYSPPLLQKGWSDDNKEIVRQSERTSNSFMMHYYVSIVLCHLFIEHLLTGILFEIHPSFLYRKTKRKEVFDPIRFAHEPSEYKNHHTIDYNQKIKRVIYLIQQADKLPVDLRIPVKYHFLINHETAMVDLGFVRNETIHLGKRNLSPYFYEVLWVNSLIPLVQDYLDCDKVNNVWLKRKVFCGIDIIGKIVDLKLNEDISDLVQMDITNRRLIELYHIKELGRTSYNNWICLDLEDYSPEVIGNIYETQINPSRRYGEEIAKNLLKKRDYHQAHHCPCCGSKALVSYEIWTETITQRRHVNSAMCTLCTYAVKSALGDPFEFEIVDSPILVYLD